MRGDDATSSITSLVQSMGSTELMRIFSIWVSRLAQQLRQLGEVHSHPVIYTDPEGDDAP